MSDNHQLRIIVSISEIVSSSNKCPTERHYNLRRGSANLIPFFAPRCRHFYPNHYYNLPDYNLNYLRKLLFASSDIDMLKVEKRSVCIVGKSICLPKGKLHPFLRKQTHLRLLSRAVLLVVSSS